MKNLMEDLEKCIKLGYSKTESIELLKILELRDINKNLSKIYDEIWEIRMK